MNFRGAESQKGPKRGKNLWKERTNSDAGKKVEKSAPRRRGVERGGGLNSLSGGKKRHTGTEGKE